MASQNDIRLFKSLTLYIPDPYYWLICRTCRVVLSLNRFPTHFSNNTYLYSRTDCSRLIKAWILSEGPAYPFKIETETDLTRWPLPTDSLAPIPFLPIYTAFHCRFTNPATGLRCTRIIMDVTGMEKHCRETHGWKSSRPVGRPSGRNMIRPKKPPWELNVPCQRFT
ncbi:hypothetical protein K469DRAFT_97878 [Zopfia rhizophila CBS 207.26]|uniref:Uncharacterized protein n=1 Tax=Zopfia rhizophila CBS 207.26 TaxID=1314779 RepID=A0A6A6D6X6_9PEZI|nr:hypothetical protein K469DRAFT_97878 [Zopfia rhizophila CBS 207.26]